MPAISSLVAQKSKASYRSGEWPTSQEINSVLAALRTTDYPQPHLPNPVTRSSLSRLLRPSLRRTVRCHAVSRRLYPLGDSLHPPSNISQERQLLLEDGLTLLLRYLRAVGHQVE